MPGTLLLDDWRKSVEDRLNEHITNLQQSTQQALQSVTQPAQQAVAPVQQAVQDPGAVGQRLNAFVDQLTQPAAQAATQTFQPLGEAAQGIQQQAQQVVQPLGDVSARLQQHVDNLVGPQTSVTPLGAPTAQADVLGAPSAPAPATVKPLQAGQPSGRIPAQINVPIDQGPSISREQTELVVHGTPLEGLGGTIYDLGVKYNVDPAFALSVARNESNYGSTPGQARNNNIWDISNALYGGTPVEGSRWGQYPDKQTAAEAFFKLITQEYYPKGQTTVGSVMWGPEGSQTHAYAPVSENSADYPQRLIDTMKGYGSGAQGAPTSSQAMASTAVLPHSEEPATANDGLGDRWKTQFDFGATYTGDYRTGTPHRGVDLVPQKGGIGTEVDAFVPGTVTNVFRDPGGAGGLIVYVQDARGLTHAYMHLQDTVQGLAVGQQVGRGTPIAHMGESGTEGSPHLHYEVRKNAASGDPLNELIDPRPYVRGAAGSGAQGAGAPSARAALPPSSEPGVIDVARPAPKAPIVSNTPLGAPSTTSNARLTYNAANQAVTPLGGAEPLQVGQGPTPREIVGGAASAIGTTARRGADVLGQGVEDFSRMLPDVGQLPGLQVPSADTPLGKVVRGEPISSLPPQDQLGAVKDWVTRTADARNQMIEAINPAKDVFVLGGLTTMIAQQIASPEMWLATGPTVALGARASEAVGAGLGRIAPEAPAVLSTVLQKVSQGAVVGGLQNALFAADQAGATPQSVGEALITGAGLGGVIDVGTAAAAPVIRRIGQAVIDRAPEIQGALRSRQPAQAQVGAALGLGPGRDVLHGQAVPRPGYEPGTPEHTTETFLQDAARSQGTPTPTLTAADVQSLPGMAGSRSRGLQEVRDATEAGLPAARWYQEVVNQVRQDTGQDINPREAAVLMGATGGNAGVQANYHAMLSVFDAMRQAKPDLVGLENLDLPGIQATQAYKDVKALVRADGAYIDDDMLAKVMRGYRTGEVPVPSGAKLSSYTQDFLHALSESYAPYSTQDVHQGRLFGARPDIQLNAKGDPAPLPNVSQNDQAYRTMHALTNWVAREMHLPPDQAQAAGWTTFRTLWNDPIIGPELRNDRIGLSDAIRQGRASGVLNPAAMRTGGLAEVAGPRSGLPTSWSNKINDVRDRIRNNGSYNTPLPESASALNDIALYHPSIQSAAQQRAIRDPSGFEYGTVSGPKTGISRPVGNEPAAGLRELALGDQPIMRVPGDVQTDANGKIPWLAPEHTVQQVGGKTYVSVVGVGDDAAHLIGTRLGADRFNHADPNGSKVGGFAIDSVAPEQRAALTRALADRGLPVLEAGSSLRVPVIEGSARSIKAAVDAAITDAGAQGASIVHYTGETHAVRPARAGANGRARGAAGAVGPSGLSAGDRLRAAVFRDEPLPPSGAVPPGTGVAGGIQGARQRGEANVPFAANLGGAVVGGYAGNAATPEDQPLDVRLRNIGLGATAGLLGGHIAGRGIGRLTPELARVGEGFRAPRPGEPRPGENLLRATTREPRNLGEVASNPHLLREAGPGETPMTVDERLAHQDTLEARYTSNQQRLDALDEMLRNPGKKPERPPWAGGYSNDQVAEMAAKVGRSPFEPLWWEKAGLETGSGEVREMLNESGIAKGAGQRMPSPAELRAEQRTLQQDQEHIQAASDQQANAPEGAQFAPPAEQTPGELPFGMGGPGGGRDEGARLAQEVVTNKGRLTSDPNQVTAEAGGITGRGIVNPSEVVREPPSEETKRLMPNLNVLGGEMEEVAAQIQKSAEDNPALWEHYRQGTITFDSLKNDLAARVGMSAKDWLKTKVGQAFNDREMVALQAAMVESQNAQTRLARDIIAKGGVDELTPEELAYSLTSMTEAQGLAAVAKGAGSTASRALNARKITMTEALASTISASNERKAAQRVVTQGKRAVDRSNELLQKTRELEKERDALMVRLRGRENIPIEARGEVPSGPVVQEQMPGTPPRTPRPGERAPKNIIDEIANAYDELDKYNALSLHEKASVFDRLKAERDARAAARKAQVRGAPEELLSALRDELKWEQNNFAKRKDTWETMAFWDSKQAENAASKRAAFRGGLYIETQRKAARLALDQAQKEAERAFDAETKRLGTESDKAKRLLEAMGGEAPTKELLRNYIAALHDPDPMVAAKFLQGTQSMSNWARASVIRIAGLVSSPITHMVNLGGNTTSAMLVLPERQLVVGIDALRARLTGGERQAYQAELLPMLQAYGPGFTGAMPNAIRTMQTGITAEQLADPKRIRAAFSGSEKVNFAVEAPLRALQAEDILYRSGAYSAHAMRVSVRQAIREGFSGEQANGRAATIMQNLQDYPELAKEATDAAARMVFQERRANVPGMGGGPAQPEATRFALAQPMPFYKTPVNITAQGGALSPFGFIGAAQSAVKSSRMPRGTLAERNAQGRETLLAEERVARGMIGSAILGMGIFLGRSGMLTGAYPDDPKEASTLPQGWRPWSLRLQEPIGGNTIYLPLQNFAMAGFPMAMAAILTDPIHRGRSILDPEEQLTTVTAIGRYALDTPFLQGLSDTVEALHDPKKAAQKFAEGLVSSYAPYGSAAREIQRIGGTPSRNPHEGVMGLVDAMAAVYPGTSGLVPEATTPLGEARTQGATGAGRLVPYRYDIERDEPTLLALRTAGVGVPGAPKTIATGRGYGIELDEGEQDTLKRARGAAIIQEVAKVRVNPRVQSWERTISTAPPDSPQYKDAFKRYNDAMQVAASNGAATGNNAFLRQLGRAEVARREKITKDVEPSYLGTPPVPAGTVGEIT